MCIAQSESELRAVHVSCMTSLCDGHLATAQTSKSVEVRFEHPEPGIDLQVFGEETPHETVAVAEPGGVMVSRSQQQPGVLDPSGGQHVGPRGDGRVDTAQGGDVEMRDGAPAVCGEVQRVGVEQHFDVGSCGQFCTVQVAELRRERYLEHEGLDCFGLHRRSFHPQPLFPSVD